MPTLDELRKNVNRSLNERAQAAGTLRKAESRLAHWENVLASKTKKRDLYKARALARYNTMSEDERVGYWVCDRKKVYAFKNDAVAFQSPNSGLHVYLCIFCTGYHAGHPPRGDGLNPKPKSIIFAMMRELGYE